MKVMLTFILLLFIIIIIIIIIIPETYYISEPNGWSGGST